MIVDVYVSTGYVGSERNIEIEVPNDIDPDLLEEIAFERMCDMIDWGYNIVKENV